jgi:hypothetical protein
VFSGLVEHILTTNTYFDNGFDDVYQDETTGLVENGEPVFPADNHGRYFYLRLPNNIRFDYSAQFTLDECSNSPGKIYDVILVACVADVNAEGLLNNLLSALSSYQERITLQSASIQGNVVINQELSFMSKDDREAALKRKPDNLTIVSISFSYIKETLLTNCITEPCSTC